MIHRWLHHVVVRVVCWQIKNRSVGKLQPEEATDKFAWGMQNTLASKRKLCVSACGKEFH